MTTVLVTGATTPIGHGVVCSLLAQGTERVIAVGAEAAALTSLPHDERMIYLRTDLSRERNIRNLIFGEGSQLEVDTVIHMAAHRNPAASGKRARKLNVELTRLLVHLVEEHPTIQRFVLKSHGEVYRMSAEDPTVIGEHHPVDMADGRPQWIRNRVEADLAACARMGMSSLSIAVVRAAECVAPNVGSQLYDYLASRLCLRPMGYDPVLNIISVDDLVDGLTRIALSSHQGIFNLPGADTLPLNELIARAHRNALPIPGPLLKPLYRARSLVRGQDFRYDLNHWRFHYSGVLSGERAKALVGYEPKHSALSDCFGVGEAIHQRA